MRWNRAWFSRPTERLMARQARNHQTCNKQSQSPQPHTEYFE